jgi:putative ABC transport system permease protein
MFKSYLKIAVRNIVKHKYFSIINVLGLALGMSFSLLLISFYSYVSSFDDFHTKKERIYRVISTMQKKGGDRVEFASAPAALAARLHDQAAGIGEIIRINSTFSGNIVSDKLNLPVRGYYADNNFFKAFDFEMIQGNPLTALSKPNAIVLTELVAKKIEPSGDLVGHSIEIEGIGTFEVTGIVKEQKRTHLMFETLVSFSSLPASMRGEESRPSQWTSYWDQYIYLLLDETSDSKNLQQSLDHIARDVYSQSREETVSFQLQALGDITPGPDLENSIGPDTDTTLFGVFTTICLLILLPACFNYGNISIARALKRSKEIGLRKTMGGVRTQIFIQFITETVAITVISLAGGILLFLLIAPEFKEMMMAESWLDLSLTWQMVGNFLVFAIAIGILTGVFPALHFAGLNPIQSLKGQSGSNAFNGIRIRRALIIFQFSLAFCFIVSLVVFNRQYRYTLNYNFGFNIQNILNVELQGIDPGVFKSEFSRLPYVQALSMSSGISGLSYSNSLVREHRGGDSLKVYQLFVDRDYVDNMKLQLLAGENFPNESVQYEQHILVNEEFLHMWQIPTPIDAIGRTFLVDNKELKVVGVLKNFHFGPLVEPIKSFFLRTDPTQFSYANIKVASPDMYATLSSMEMTWRKLNNTRRFEARFLDDDMQKAYGFYWALLKIIGYMGLLAVAISLLGLLGMVVYTTEMRTKEIGIRKVMGAHEASITYLLSKDFLKLMLWATGFAIPASMLLFDNFLSALQYYRVSLNVWDLLTGFVVFFSIGIATITSQTWKAATANPVDILRYE